jgi:hypothetical protein
VKRKALALALMLALSFLAAEATVINFAKANPIGYLWFPTEPVKTPPVITVYCPSQNQAYDSTSILLNFSVSKPETWFNWYEEEHLSGIYLTIGKVVSYNYTLDDNESQAIPVDDGYDWTLNPEEALNFSTNLTLPYGVHNITIVVECESAYRTSNVSYQSVPIKGYSDVISFSVVEPNTFSIAPIAIASVASGVIAAAGLLAYFRKRKRS